MSPTDLGFATIKTAVEYTTFNAVGLAAPLPANFNAIGTWGLIYVVLTAIFLVLIVV